MGKRESQVGSFDMSIHFITKNNILNLNFSDLKYIFIAF